MLNLVEIARLNAKTFYDYSSETQYKVTGRYITVAIISLFTAVVFRNNSDNLYLGIITAQSILVGFGFNVLIFLSANHASELTKSDSLETQNKVVKSVRVGTEIFYNISYFNMVALICVVVALALLALNTVPRDLITSILRRLSVPSNVLNLISGNADDWGLFWLFVLHAVLYCVLIESVATFARAISRVTYYFKSQIELTSANGGSSRL